MIEAALMGFGVVWVMVRQEEGSESHKVLVKTSRIFWASAKEELSRLRVRLNALVQPRTAPRCPNSC